MDSRRNNIAKMASSPLREHNRRFAHSPLLSPGNSRLVKNRYCVSDMSSSSSRMLNNYSPGPLLAPLNYNTSISTYIDCKSPGLSGRIVQYSGETADRTESFVSHQAKYSSPGMYPIVHLEKKSLPVRVLPRDTVTMRLMTLHDAHTYSMNTNGFHNDNGSSNVSSTSVISALKEISKKRMPSEDIILPPKRQRNERHISIPEKHVNISNVPTVMVEDTSKSPIDEVPCVADALAASFTSSNTSLVNSRHLLKRKINSPASINTPPKENVKQVLVEVETQTDNLKISSVTQTVEEEPKSKVLRIQDVGSTAKDETNSMAYDDILKSKLSSSLSDVSGEKRPLVPNSILSPPDKPKHNKHVAFNIPDKAVEESTVVVDTPISVSNDKVGLATPTPLNAPILPVVSVSSTITEFIPPSVIVAPVSKSAVTTASFNIPIPDVIATTSIDLTKGTSPTSVIFSTPPALPKLSSPSLFTVSSATTTLPLSFITPNTNTNKEEGPLSMTAPLTFGAVSSNEPKSNTTSKFTVTPTSITFGSIPSTIQKSVGTDTSATTSSLIFGSSPFSIPKSLGSGTELFTPMTTSAPLSQPKVVSPGKASVIGVSSPTNKPGGFKFDLATSIKGGFGGDKSTTTDKPDSTFMFGNTKPIGPAFGDNTKVTSTFGASSIPSTGLETQMPPNLVLPVQKDSGYLSGLTSTFNTPTGNTSAQPQVSTAPKFLNFEQNNTVMPPPMFNSPPAATDSSMFKFRPTTTTTTAMFSIPAAFTTTVPASNPNSFQFGTPPTTTPSIFNAPTFGASSKPSMFTFGSPTLPATAPSTFKDTKQQSGDSTFNFAVTSTRAGTSDFHTSAFNSVPEPSAFKFHHEPSGVAGPLMFNKAPLNTVSSNQNDQGLFKFGTSTTAETSIFKSPSFNFTTPAITSVPKVPPPSFPATTTASFNAFGGFDSKPVNPFNTSGFGDNKSTMPFGTDQTFGIDNKATAMFGSVPQNQNIFGSPTNQPFGSAAPMATAPTQPFQFGAPNNPQANVFSFGGSNEPAKSVPSNIQSGVFSFGANTTNNAFGSAPTATFGGQGVAPNNFMQSVPTFGAQTQPTPMFNIGTGSTTPKPRTQLKARRRT